MGNPEVQAAGDELDSGRVVLRNCNVISVHEAGPGGAAARVASGVHVVIEGKRIAYVGQAPPPGVATTETVVDVQGGFVIPGLCDAHVHVTAVSAHLHDLLVLPSSLVTARASAVLRDMLLRGFTTVRDAGGCDWGLAKVSAPRNPTF